MLARGFNDSDIPMFIFQEELIPVDHVLERHIHSLRALQCYLSLQASTALKTTRQWHREEQPPYSCNNVWIQPRKGMIVIGPPGPRPIKYFDVEEDLGSGTQNPSLPPLPIGLYTTNALLPYLDEHASSNSILSILSALAKHNPEPIEDLPVHCQILAFPNRDPLVKCQSCWTYEAHHLGPSRNYLGQPTVMEDGRSR
ncbi:hypothetical protein L218DRAFT_351106 [Marasmius fiardii PR-910]|nr:hypothetical protein L218DRAFT_351106 [Marasmius fiardii PR-910]